MSFMEKILIKSDSYNYYKSQYEKLRKIEDKNKKEISDLKNELKMHKIEIENYKKDISFLRQELINCECNNVKDDII